MEPTVRRHRLATFLAITFAVSWAPWLVLAARRETVSAGFSAAYLAGLVGPLVGAVITTWRYDGRAGLRDLAARMVRVRVGAHGWASLGVLLAVAALTYVAVVTYAVFLLAPVTLPDAAAFGEFSGFPVVHAALLVPLLILVNGYGEETGWRGFLLPELERRWSPLTASFVIAAIWGVWHLPAFLINENYGAMTGATVAMFYVGLLCGSLFLTWLYNRGHQSIALVAVWHGLFNLLSGTVAARGLLAAAETTVVMGFACILLIRELAATYRDRHHHDGKHVLSPT